MTIECRQRSVGDLDWSPRQPFHSTRVLPTRFFFQSICRFAVDASLLPPQPASIVRDDPSYRNSSERRSSLHADGGSLDGAALPIVRHVDADGFVTCQSSRTADFVIELDAYDFDSFAFVPHDRLKPGSNYFIC